jgi:hypothetical protein
LAVAALSLVSKFRAETNRLAYVEEAMGKLKWLGGALFVALAAATPSTAAD